jgi:hypothetical protein
MTILQTVKDGLYIAAVVIMVPLFILFIALCFISSVILDYFCKITPPPDYPPERHEWLKWGSPDDLFKIAR